MPDDRIAFPLETLLAGADSGTLTVCPDGHLVVAARTHWAPRALSPDLRSLVCDWVEHDNQILNAE